jgi:hypothetical protein
MCADSAACVSRRLSIAARVQGCRRCHTTHCARHLVRCDRRSCGCNWASRGCGCERADQSDLDHFERFCATAAANGVPISVQHDPDMTAECCGNGRFNSLLRCIAAFDRAQPSVAPHTGFTAPVWRKCAD